ncbi:hypothetical protein [Roseomonas sp. BN140053]|uniref:hypothetical protein n=1 Tax=Roseomonas sp. BN140053 TaxID=3391898 RepID=UPI0039E85223
MTLRQVGRHLLAAAATIMCLGELVILLLDQGDVGLFSVLDSCGKAGRKAILMEF